MDYFKLNQISVPCINSVTGLPDGFKFLEVFNSKRNVNGIVGKIGDDSNNVYIYKICKFFENSVQHEWNILQMLNKLRPYCPHFVYGVSYFDVMINDTFKRSENTFLKENDRKQIKKDVLLLEYVDGEMFGPFLRRTQKKHLAFSLCKQTLIALMIAQYECSFTHYDCHTDNILIKKCPLNSVFLYVLQDEKYLVPSYGYMPVIIDFGYSYNQNCHGTNMNTVCAYTHDGFTSAIYDNDKDFKVFLCHFSYRIVDYFKHSKNVRAIREYIEKLYSKEKKTDLDSGWDSLTEESISQLFENKIMKIFEKSDFDFFENESSHVISILEHLIELPFTQNSDDSTSELIRTLVAEFEKIEKCIKADYYKLYILYTMVRSATKNKKKYLSKDKQDDAVTNFRNDTLKAIDDVAKFANPRGIKWDKLLCALLCLGRAMGKFYRLKMSLLKDEKLKIKPDRNSKEIYHDLDQFMPTPFIYDEETIIYIFDTIKKETRTLHLNTPIITLLNNEQITQKEKCETLLKLN